MIVIDYNHDSLPISIVSCQSIESARAFWQGAGILPHTERIFDINEDRENEKQGYVTPLLKTKTDNPYRNGFGKDKVLIIIG